MPTLPTPPSLNPDLLSQNPTLQEQFLAPLIDVLHNYTRGSWDCPEIPDEEFLRLGCRRVLSQARSGRDFVQHQQETETPELKRASFFALLHSDRRLGLLRECALQLYHQAGRQLGPRGEDLLAAFPLLRHRAVWAVDGHQIEHACHALKDDKERHVAPKSLYLLCLHTGLLHNLNPVQGDGVYQHELPVLRGFLPAWLQRQKLRRWPAPLLVLDPAYVDKQFWTRMKLLGEAGAVMITRTKENMKPERYTALAWDRHDPTNLGIQAQFLVGFDGAALMRVIEYVDPETGEAYEFLTTEMGLPPGLIAWLYLLRWRIEKVFDTAKNKLQETKAWASGAVAQEIQAHFFAVTHNLLVLFRSYLQSEHGASEIKLVHKREASLKERAQRALALGRQVHPLHYRMPPVVQLSVQFIRTLRNLITRKARLTPSLPRLQAVLQAYL